MQRQRHGKKRHGEPDDLPMPERFGDALTADHAILGADETSREGHTVTLIILDRKTSWLQAFPAPRKRTEEVNMAFRGFLRPNTAYLLA